nr:EVE domain-containing protein [Mesorhizobium sp.]
MPRCWIGVAAARHVRIAVESGFAMFAHGRHSAALRTQPGDWVAYYSPREGMNEGGEVRAFAVIGRILPGEPHERQMTAAGDTGWQRNAEWLPSRNADIYPLLDRFSFVRDRGHWGMYFRKSLFPIERGDFALIAASMGVGDAFEGARTQED